MGSWPGVPVQDATSDLERRHRQSAIAVPESERATQCDRCQAGLLDGVYLLKAGPIDGRKAVWFLCVMCDRELTTWFHEPPARG